MSLDFKPVNNTSPAIKHKPTINPFTEQVMGDWKFDKKSSSGDTLWWVRKAEINLAEVYAQDYIDPKSMKAMKIFGEVILLEKKAVSKVTSASSMFRSVEPTEKSVIKEIII